MFKDEREKWGSAKMETEKMGMIMFVLSIVGLGPMSTLVQAFMQKDEAMKSAGIKVWLLQAISAIIVVGYVWGILTSKKVWENSK